MSHASGGPQGAPGEAFRFSLALLRRGPIQRTVELADPAQVLGELPDGMTGPLRVDLQALTDGRGVRITGEVQARRTADCRRCLEEVTEDVVAQIDAWFLQGDAEDASEESVWPLNPGSGEVDATPAVREELWLASSDYLLCSPDCEGLCPQCGAVRASEDCACTVEETDSRWAALEALRTGDPTGDDEPSET